MINTTNPQKKTLFYKKRIVVTVCVYLMIFVSFVSAFLIFDYVIYKPCGWTEGNVEQWESLFPDNIAYEMGINNKNMPVFRNPAKALNQIKIDYKDGIKEIKKQFKLLPLSKYTYKKYGTFGFEINTEGVDESVGHQARKVSGFFDIYENSFE